MRPFAVSDETRDVIALLYRAKPDIFESLHGKHTLRMEDLFEHVAASDELNAVPSIVSFLSARKPVAEAAKAAMRSLMSERTFNQLCQLDEICRHHFAYYLTAGPWPSVPRGELSRLVTPSDVHVLGVLSFHPSGWVREEAVTLLNKHTSGDELAYLFIRANDWVAPVREHAWSAIRQRLNPGYADAFAANLSAVVALTHKKRVNKDELLEDIHAYLLSRPSILEQATSNEDFRTRRAAYQMAYQLDDERSATFIERALTDPDAVVRLGAAKRAASLSSASVRDGFLQTLLGDRWHAIRLQGVYLALNGSEETKRAVLLDRLLDPSSGVRAAARYYLRQLGVESFRSFYTKALSEKPSNTAILGLGECGQADDATLIRAFLESSNPKTVSAAVMSMSRLQPDESDNLLLKQLTHASKVPSNAAARQLRFRVTHETHPELERIYFDESLPLHARLNALKLLGKAGKWNALVYWLRGAVSVHARLSEHCYRGLVRWQRHFNCSFTQPSASQIQEIGQLVERPEFDGHAIRPFLKSLRNDF